MKGEAIIRGGWPKNKWRRVVAESLRQAAISAGTSAGYTLCGLAVMLGIWSVVSGVSQSLPGPFATLKVLAQLLADPFYDNGPNDKGIGIQLASSIGRVFVGFGLGSLVAVPAGALMGASSVCRRLFNPLAQLLRPVSPLAWFPIGLAVFKHAGEATIFVIFVTSLWPTLINTAFGVGSLPDDHRNVARSFAFSRGRYLRRVLIPFALPHILTGLRLSLGIAWVVIVAGE